MLIWLVLWGLKVKNSQKFSKVDGKKNEGKRELLPKNGFRQKRYWFFRLKQITVDT